MSRTIQEDSIIARHMTSVSRETSSEWCVIGESGSSIAPLPDAEEMRMVRAIALLALLEAARRGTYCATFRDCAVNAVRRTSAKGAASTVDVRLSITLGAAVQERYDIALLEDALDDVRSAGSCG